MSASPSSSTAGWRDVSTERDEEELQEILEKNPRADMLQCIFCDNLAYTYVEPEEVGLQVPQDVEGPVAVCSECWPDDDGRCFDCMVFNFCPDHMTPEEFELFQSIKLSQLDNDDGNPIS